MAVTVQAVLKELGDGSLQGSVSEVLDICRSIKKAKDALTVSDFKALRDQSPFTTKVWSKLLQVGMDDRLEAIKEHLPASYTTLHLIHCFSDEELQAGVKDGHIHPKVSQGALNRWIKSYRFEDAAQEVPEDFSTLVSVLGPKEWKRRCWNASRATWRSWWGSTVPNQLRGRPIDGCPRQKRHKTRQVRWQHS